MSEGVDFAFGRPGAAALVAAGKTFVLRYAPYPGDGGKGLTLDEVQEYHAAGLGIGLVFESTGGRPHGGYANGREDGLIARQGADSVGFPDSLPIYFAVDYDVVSGPDWQAIADYFRGINSVLPVLQMGDYGEADVIDFCHDNGLTAWHWQTAAWSGGRVSQWAHLLQYQNEEIINGAEVDFDRSFGDEQGLWWPEQQEDELTANERMLFTLACGNYDTMAGCYDAAIAAGILQYEDPAQPPPPAGQDDNASATVKRFRLLSILGQGSAAVDNAIAVFRR